MQRPRIGLRKVPWLILLFGLSMSVQVISAFVFQTPVSPRAVMVSVHNRNKTPKGKNEPRQYFPCVTPQPISSSITTNTRVYSKSEDTIGIDDFSTNNATTKEDIITLSLHLISCVIFASVLTMYEGYDCSYLKPESATIRNYPSSTSSKNMMGFNYGGSGIVELMTKSTRGMGRGIQDRQEGWYEDTYYTSRDYAKRSDIQSSSNSDPARNLKSYNEVMLEHRTKRIPSWKNNLNIANNDDTTKNYVMTRSEFDQAIEVIIQSLETIQILKSNAHNYEWEDMLTTLRGPTLTSNLQTACSTLQRARAFLSLEAREEIGFDWGSCAWRHCGAQADAQEALAQLYNSVGLFEPYECLFALDIVERSLRDVLMVIPADLKPITETGTSAIIDRVGEYQVYKVYPPEINSDGELWVGEGDDEYDAIDKDYLDALSALSAELGSFDDDNEDAGDDGS
uniref:Uncharacterized protein n=1 Tax=Chaetoceros debilis TaxID=122233 RepID=A0A7S3PU41_9STRA